MRHGSTDYFIRTVDRIRRRPRLEVGVDIEASVGRLFRGDHVARPFFRSVVLRLLDFEDFPLG